MVARRHFLMVPSKASHRFGNILNDIVLAGTGVENNFVLAAPVDPFYQSRTRNLCDEVKSFSYFLHRC
jgi:hypothetical protein